VPAIARAAEAVAANPEKSDRAIAADLGVSRATVQRARNTGGSYEPPEQRIGRDGKSYPATRPSAPAEGYDETGIEDDIDPEDTGRPS
jgi:hypothetical protein